MLPNLRQREAGELQSPPRYSDYLDENDHMKRFDRSIVLEGHEGCVNTLNWNRDGRLLASGSDDHKVIVWDWQSKRKMSTLTTGHTENIFAVAFVPENERYLLSGAGDGMIYLHHNDEAGVETWGGERGRIKQITTVPTNPHSFFSHDERSLFQIDRRVGKEDQKLISRSEEGAITSFAISPENDNFVVVVGVRNEAYDRRNMKKRLLGLTGIPTESRRATYCTFNKEGTEMLICTEMSTEVYRFEPAGNMNISERIKAICSREDEPPHLEVPPTDDERSKASDYFKEKRYNLAHSTYCDILAKNNLDPMVRSILQANRALCLLHLSEENTPFTSSDTKQEAVRACVQALEAHPGNFKAMYRLIKCVDFGQRGEIFDAFRLQFPSKRAAAKELIEWMKNINEALEELVAMRELDLMGRILADGISSQTNPKNLYGKSSKMWGPAERYLGVSNVLTDIKQAAFFGSEEQFIVSATDTGHMMWFDRRTGGLFNFLKADDRVLNIIQPHPTLPLLAVSGFANTIEIWQPNLELELPSKEEIHDNLDESFTHFSFMEMNFQMSLNRRFMF